MSGKAVSSACRLTADSLAPARNVSTAAVASTRHQNLVGAQAHLEAGVESVVATVSTRTAGSGLRLHDRASDQRSAEALRQGRVWCPAAAVSRRGLLWARLSSFSDRGIGRLMPP